VISKEAHLKNPFKKILIIVIYFLWDFNGIFIHFLILLRIMFKMNAFNRYNVFEFSAIIADI